MRFFEELAGRVEEAAEAGGKFADSLVRLAGATVSRTLVFVDRELAFAQKAAKKATAGRTAPEKRVAHKQG